MTTTEIACDDARTSAVRRFVLFDYGFRPFFLLAGVYALAVVPVWLYYFAHHAVPFGTLPAMYWHAHELLYGFVGAAIAGFLLTAVPSWTGAKGFAGRPLVVLVGLWLAGRVSMATVEEVPFWVTAAAELSFMPALAWLLMPPLLRSENRNTPLLGVIGVLWMSDAAVMFALKNGDVALAPQATGLAMNLVLVLVTVIGGRIVPSFTANALRRRGAAADVRSWTWLEIVVVASMLAIVLADVFWPATALTGVLAAIAAVAHAVRLSGWRSFRTRGESILWILHVGYAWLPVGLALKACWILGGFAWAMKWQHALTTGVFGTMVLAVMTRASLGHTGRPLVVSRAITIAYVFLTLAVLLRVFGAALWPADYLLVVTAAGILWVLCFLLYLIVYTPILVGPRAEGKPG